MTDEAETRLVAALHRANIDKARLAAEVERLRRAGHRTWECGYCPFNAKVGGPCEGGPGLQQHWFMKDDPIPDFLDDVLAGS